MDLDNGLTLVAVLPLLFARLSFWRDHHDRERRKTALILQQVLASGELSAAERRLLLRFFYGCLRWWFLPLTLMASSVLVPRLCFWHADRHNERLSDRTFPFMLRCLRLQVYRYPLITLAAGAPLLAWMGLVGILALLLPGGRSLDVNVLARTLSGGLMLVSD